MPYQEPSIERQLVQSQREKKRALLFAKNPIKKVRIVKRAVGLTALFTGTLIIASIIWSNRMFSAKTLTQVVFHIKVPVSGSDEGILWNWIFQCVLSAVAITMLIIVFTYKLYYAFSKKIGTYTEVLSYLGIGSLGLSFGYALKNYGVLGYGFHNVQKTNLYDTYYVDPKSVSITFSKKRNLVHIFLESIESTYASSIAGGAYDTSYIPELETLAQNNIHFSHTDGLGGSRTVDGTQWTIAAMVAQTAGIPLTLPWYDQYYQPDSSFLPGCYTIGDILQEQGYNQELLQGSDASFAATANYFKQHGNYTIMDYPRVKKEGRIDSNYHVFWGFEDEKLFSFASEDILKLAATNQPFNITMATIDSHTPDGYLSSKGPNHFKKQYENVIAYQSMQVANFVAWLQQQSFYDNTTVVITGDHNSMSNKFFHTLDKNYIRTPYNVILNAPIEPIQTKHRQFTTMDWFPTILAAMGASIEGDRLGLGTNLFSSLPTLVEQKGLAYLNREVQKQATYYTKQILKGRPK